MNGTSPIANRRASSATSSVNITRMATRPSMTRWSAWRRISPCACLLIDGQGNFGSVDGDPPAAMRYTEVRLQKVTGNILDDLDKDTVDFQDNYDNSEREPVVMPARFPNLLVNGAGGIAVGMATNIPPHNLGEVIDACIAYLDNPGDHHRRADRDHPRPGFPDRRPDPRPRRHSRRLSQGARLHRHARPRQRRDRAQGARGAHHHRDPLSGEQGDDDRAHRRTGAREAHRGHFRCARRIRPPGLPRRHRAEARRRRRCGAQPALPLHHAAKLVRRQYRRAEWRPARAAQPQGHDPGLRAIPRSGRVAPHEIPS